MPFYLHLMRRPLTPLSRCFTNDGSEAVGTVTYRDGTHAVVTASPVDLDSVMAPPAYYAPDFVGVAAYVWHSERFRQWLTSRSGDGIARSIPGSVHPKVAFAPAVAYVSFRFVSMTPHSTVTAATRVPI